MTEADRTLFGRHPILARAVLVISSIVLTIVVIDVVAFYALGLRRIGSGSEAFFQPSSFLGWAHVPNADGTWYSYKDGTSTHVRINSFGFPDVERERAKNRRRIALVGDSTTEFWEVEQDERAQHVMEKLLAGRVEVLNFGLRGAGTDQEFLSFTNEVVHFSPDIVVLFFCVNDFQNNVTTEGKPYFVLDPGGSGGIRLEGVPVRHAAPPRDSWTRRLLEQSFTLRQAKYFVAGAGTFFHPEGTLEENFELRPFKRVYDAEDQRRLELLKLLLAAFASYSRDHNIHFLLVEGLYRPALDAAMQGVAHEAYGDQFDFDKVSELLSEHSVIAGYDFLSLPRLVRQRGLDVRQLMHPQDTMHLNAAGIRLFASAVIDKIREKGWLDAESAITTSMVR